MRRAGAALAAAIAVAGCATTRADPAPAGADASAAVAPARSPPMPAAAIPAGMQYLYGSGEAAAISGQAYNALLDHVRMRLAAVRARPGAPRVSVVLAPGATLDRPATLPCADQPPAVVFDMDETLVLNLGFEYADARGGGGGDARRWARWERTGGAAVAAVPGAVAAFVALRAMGVAIVINTNRDAAEAAGAIAALRTAELGEFSHGDTLFLKGDVDGRTGKDGRRAEIAKRFCVVALAGDQLGDFSDLFAQAVPAARRAGVQAPAVQGMWGRGWFVLPNPVYGSGLGSDWDATFPADRRWTDPGEQRPPTDTGPQSIKEPN